MGILDTKFTAEAWAERRRAAARQYVSPLRCKPVAWATVAELETLLAAISVRGGHATMVPASAFTGPLAAGPGRFGRLLESLRLRRAA